MSDQRRYERNKRRRNNRKAAGLCRCGNIPEVGHKCCSRCQAYGRKNALAYRIRQRQLVFDHYGWRCACCGETESAFLTLDHKNNDGAYFRRYRQENGGITLYRYVIKAEFPVDLQTLCFNCNCAKGIYGKCPHQK